MPKRKKTAAVTDDVLLLPGPPEKEKERETEEPIEKRARTKPKTINIDVKRIDQITQDTIYKATMEVEKAVEARKKIDPKLWQITRAKFLPEEEEEDQIEDPEIPVLVYKGVRWTLDDIQEQIEPLNYDSDSTFFDPEAALAIIAFETTQDRNAAKAAIAQNFPGAEALQISTLHESECTSAPIHIAYLHPTTRNTEEIEIALQAKIKMPIRSVKHVNSGKYNFTAIGFFQEDSLKASLEIPSIQIAGTRYTITRAYEKSENAIELFVGNVDGTVRKKQLLCILRKHRINVTEVTMVRDTKTLQARGCAFIKLPTADDTWNAISTIINCKDKRLSFDWPNKASK